MARVVLTVAIQGGTSFQAVVSGKESYPDAMSTLKRECVDGLKQVLDHYLGDGVEDVCAAIEAGLEDEG